jgi:hypothetical protein
MPPTIISDDEGETRVAVRPVRKTKPTAALLHSAEPATLSFQKKAVNDFRIAEAARCTKQAEGTELSSVAGPSQQPTSTTSKTAATPPTSHVPNQTKRVRVDLEEIFEDNEDDDDVEMRESAYINPKCECYNLLLTEHSY